MSLQHLHSFEYRRSRWRNGLGWTREIASEVDPQDGERWRVSIAEIDHNCTYSAFPGCRRLQTLVDGAGFTLQFADGRVQTCQPPHGRLEFDGADVPSCVLTDGPVRVFNVFHAQDRLDATLLHRPLVGSLLVFAEAGTRWLIHQLAGQAQLSDGSTTIEVGQGDSALLDNRNGLRQRLMLDGGGQVLLLSFAPAP